MKTFQCNKCGHQLQRPAVPYRCPQCGSQAVGLFKLIQSGASPAQPAGSAGPPGVPPAQAGVPPPGVPPAPRPGVSPPGPGIPPAPPAPSGAVRPPPAAEPQAAPPAYEPPARPTGPAKPQAAPPAYEPPARPTPPAEPQAASPAAEAPAQPVPPPTAPTAQPPAERAAPPQETRPSAPEEAKRAKPKETKRPVLEETKRPAPAKAQPPKPKVKPKPKPKPVRPPQFAWAYPEEPPAGESKPLTNAPAVDPAGRVFLHVQGRLVALREQEGRPEICWEYVTSSHAPGPTSVAPDGSIRLHCSDGLLHCVSCEGKQVWTPAGVGEPLGYAAPVVDQQGNTYISAFDGGLIQVDARGRVVAGLPTAPLSARRGQRPAPNRDPGRYFRSRQKFDAAGVVHQGVLYIGSEEGYVFAIRLDGGRGQNLWDHAAQRGHAGWYVRCWPAVTGDGTLVVAGRDEHLHGFAPDGKPAWRTKMPGQLLASPVIDPHGHVYVGLSQSRRGQEPRGALVSIDGNSHKIRWQYQAAGPVESTPVIGEDEVIYFGDNSGLVHAVDFHGKARWRAQLEAAVRSAGTILAPERVAFGLDNETLVVLKCSSKGLAGAGWPKIGRTLGQCGMA